MKSTARISSFNVERGFGFVTEPSNARSWFHVTSCQNFIPQVNQIVEFDATANAKGRTAINLVLIDSSAVVSVDDPVQMLLAAIKNAKVGSQS